MPVVQISRLQDQCSVDFFLNQKKKAFNPDSFLQGEPQPEIDKLCSASKKFGDSSCENLYLTTHTIGDWCKTSVASISYGVTGGGSGSLDNFHPIVPSLASPTSDSIQIHVNSSAILTPADLKDIDSGGQDSFFKSMSNMASRTNALALKAKDQCLNFQTHVNNKGWHRSRLEKQEIAKKFLDTSQQWNIIRAENDLRKICTGAGANLGTAVGNAVNNVVGGLLGGPVSRNPSMYKQRNDSIRGNMMSALKPSSQPSVYSEYAEDLFCDTNEYIAELQLQRERIKLSFKRLEEIVNQLAVQYNTGFEVGIESDISGLDLSSLGGSGSIASTGINQNQRLAGAPQAQLSTARDTAGSALSRTASDTGLGGAPAAPVSPSGIGSIGNSISGAVGSAASSTLNAVGAAGSFVGNNIVPIGVVGLGAAGVAAATSHGGGSSGSAGSQNNSNSPVSVASINAISAASSASNTSSNTSTTTSTNAQSPTTLAGTTVNPNTALLSATGQGDGSGISGNRNTTGASSVSSSLKDAVRDRLSNGGGAGAGGSSSAGFSGTFGQLSSASDGRDTKVGAKGSGFSSAGTLDGSGAEVKAPVAVAGSETDASIKDIMQNMQAMMGGAAEPMENLSNNTAAGGESRAPASTKGSSYSFDREVAAADTAPLFERVHESINRCLNKGCIINGLGNKL